MSTEEKDHYKVSGLIKRSRKNLLLNRSFQMRHISWIVLFMLAMSVCYAVSFNMMLNVVLPEEVRAEYIDRFDLMMPWLFTTITFVTISVWYGIWITHRIVGPIYGLKRTMNAVIQGNYDIRIKLRPDDEFQEVAAEFNRLMEAMSARSANQ